MSKLQRFENPDGRYLLWHQLVGFGRIFGIVDTETGRTTIRFMPVSFPGVDFPKDEISNFLNKEDICNLLDLIGESGGLVSIEFYDAKIKEAQNGQ